MPTEFDVHYWRRLMAACQEPPQSFDDFFIDERSADADDWSVLLEGLSDRILWDGDWDMPELFMDVDPELSRARRRRLGIERNYFTTPGPDPSDQELPSLLAGLREVLGDDC